jgi:hypothetical protein
MVLAFALAASTLSHAQTAEIKPVKVNGETRVALGTAVVVVRTKEIQEPKGESKAESSEENRISACTGGRVPCLLTYSLQIMVDDKVIWIPYSSYADLGDMGSLTLQRFRQGYRLTIYGGDASVAYVAKLDFNRRRVLDRVIAPGEDSTQPSERTMYYNPKRFE